MGSNRQSVRGLKRNGAVGRNEGIVKESARDGALFFTAPNYFSTLKGEPHSRGN
jgi:hypothetical protein